MSPPSHRWTWLAVLLVMGLGLAPWLWLVDIVPQSRDAVMWLQNADPSRSDWFEWTFLTRQFKVTLRPVAALSYTLTRALGGLEPAAHRLLDLALHGLVIGLTYAVVRRWSTRAPAWGGVMAAAVVALHPLVRYVVPDLARRSYSLTTVFVLLALLATPRNENGAPARAWRGIVAAGLAAGAALAHEVGYLAFALCALLVVPPVDALRDTSRWRDAILHQRWLLGASGLSGAVLLGWRFVALQGPGGYQRSGMYPLSNAARTLEGLVPLYAVGLDWLGPVVGVAIAGGSLGVGVWVARRELAAGASDPVLRIALAWIGGALLLFLPQPVWFIRQVYLLLPPLALLVASLLGPSRPRLARGTALAWPIALVLIAPWELANIEQERVRATRTSEMIGDLLDFARTVPDGDQVVLALPRWRSPRVLPRGGGDDEVDEDSRGLPIGIRAPVTWVELVEPGPRYTLALVAFTTIGATGPVWRAELDERVVRLDIVGTRRVAPLPFNRLGRVDGDAATIRLPDRLGTVSVYVHDGQRSHRWVVPPAGGE